MVSINKINLCVLDSFAAPRDVTDLIIFRDGRFCVPEDNQREYLQKCQAYASENGVYLVPSRFIIRGYLCLCLINPKGQFIGMQRATHINLLRKNEFKRGDRIEICKTSLGMIFLCVDSDIYHPEVLRGAKDEGAQLVISSQHIAPHEYTADKILTGCYNAAVSNFLYVVSVNNMGCCITAPKQATDDGSGFIMPPQENLPLTSKLFLQKLEKAEQNSRFNVYNEKDFRGNYFGQLTN